MSVSIRRAGNCYPCISRILSMSKHMVGGYEGLCVFGVSIHIIPTQLPARLLLSVLVIHWQFPQGNNSFTWMMDFSEWNSSCLIPFLMCRTQILKHCLWNKKCTCDSPYCKMIEQNNSLGTNVPLPSLGMSVIFLSGLWAWFKEGTEQQNLCGSADWLMYWQNHQL